MKHYAMCSKRFWTKTPRRNGVKNSSAACPDASIIVMRQMSDARAHDTIMGEQEAQWGWSYVALRILLAEIN